MNHKRIAIIVFFQFLILMGLFGQQSIQGVITGNNLRVRNEPSINSGIMGNLNSGDTVEIIGKSISKEKIGNNDDYWYMIIFFIEIPDIGETITTAGWVYGGFVDLGENEVPEIVFEYDSNTNSLIRILTNKTGTYRRQLSRVHMEEVSSDSDLIYCEFGTSHIDFQYCFSPGIWIFDKKNGEAIIYYYSSEVGYHTTTNPSSSKYLLITTPENLTRIADEYHPNKIAIFDLGNNEEIYEGAVLKEPILVTDFLIANTYDDMRSRGNTDSPISSIDIIYDNGNIEKVFEGDGNHSFFFSSINDETIYIEEIYVDNNSDWKQINLIKKRMHAISIEEMQ